MSKRKAKKRTPPEFKSPLGRDELFKSHVRQKTNPRVAAEIEAETNRLAGHYPERNP